MKLLKKSSKSISENIEKLYPAPDPRIRAFSETDFLVYLGMINSTGEILDFTRSDEFKKYEKTASKEDVEKFHKGFFLLMTRFNPGNQDIKNLFEDLIEVADKARKNELFVNV